MIRTTDVSVIEALEVCGAVEGGLVSRENLRAEDESLREVDSKGEEPIFQPFVPCHHTKTSILQLTSFDSSF